MFTKEKLVKVKCAVCDYIYYKILEECPLCGAKTRREEDNAIHKELVLYDDCKSKARKAKK